MGRGLWEISCPSRVAASSQRHESDSYSHTQVVLWSDALRALQSTLSASGFMRGLWSPVGRGLWEGSGSRRSLWEGSGRGLWEISCPSRVSASSQRHVSDSFSHTQVVLWHSCRKPSCRTEPEIQTAEDVRPCPIFVLQQTKIVPDG